MVASRLWLSSCPVVTACRSLVRAFRHGRATQRSSWDPWTALCSSTPAANHRTAALGQSISLSIIQSLDQVSRLFVSCDQGLSHGATEAAKRKSSVPPRLSLRQLALGRRDGALQCCGNILTTRARATSAAQQRTPTVSWLAGLVGEIIVSLPIMPVDSKSSPVAEGIVDCIKDSTHSGTRESMHVAAHYRSGRVLSASPGTVASKSG